MTTTVVSRAPTAAPAVGRPALTWRDSLTMLRRDLRHRARYLSLTLMLVGLPVVLLLLFVFVFGGTLEAGIAAQAGVDVSYIDYVVPGIVLLSIASVAQGTAISVATDMTGGIVARLRTMSIARVAVLTGHVLGSVLQNLVAVALVVVVAVLCGFRPTASATDWLLAAGVVTLIAFALTWLGVGLGMAAKSVEEASNTPMFLMLLPFFGSGFVPTESMPGPVAWVAEHQPFTPFMDTLRSLLLGTPMGSSGWLTLAWCAVIALGGYVWSRWLYERRSLRA